MLLQPAEFTPNYEKLQQKEYLFRNVLKTTRRYQMKSLLNWSRKIIDGK